MADPKLVYTDSVAALSVHQIRIWPSDLDRQHRALYIHYFSFLESWLPVTIKWVKESYRLRVTCDKEVVNFCLVMQQYK